MFLSKFFQKSTLPAQHNVPQESSISRSLDPLQHNVPQESSISRDLEPRIIVHYGVPATASILAFDPIQQLLAIGTLDGRIKVIGRDMEGLLVSPSSLPFKNLEFVQNQCLLVSVSNENQIQVWDLKNSCLSSTLQWESNITAFSVIYGTHYMYLGDEHGYISVLKYDAEEGNIQQLPYNIPPNLISEAAEILLPDHQSVVGLLPQPCSNGNRVLIAYGNGLIVLWDVTEDRALVVKGFKDLQLQDEIEGNKNLSDLSDHDEVDKEISSLCWVSSDGSIIAVGYVDGDILLWDLSIPDSSRSQQAEKSSKNFVKLQLSSGDRRLPVITLRWASNTRGDVSGGQLLVYGGDDIGSEEVLTILNLDWSAGIAMLKCVDRVDLPLVGSFADAVVISNADEVKGSDASSLFVLANPGQLQFYDNTCLSTLKSKIDNKQFVCSVEYPAVIPTVEPCMTAAKWHLLDKRWKLQRNLPKTVSGSKQATWPLTGHMPHQLSFTENHEIERLYIGGYQDGSVRVWDASFPSLSLIFVIGEMVEVPDANPSVSALEFCSSAFTLAVGNECGQVRLYRLEESSETTSLQVVTETKLGVDNSSCDDRIQCAAMFSLISSPVSALRYVPPRSRLVIGFDCSQVAILDVTSLSVLFLTDYISGSRSAIISLTVETIPDAHSNSVQDSGNRINESEKDIVFILTRDAHMILMDGTTGNLISSQVMHSKEESTAISMYILEANPSVPERSDNHSPISPQYFAKSQPALTNPQPQDPVEVENPTLIATWGHNFMDSLILLCCKSALYLFSLKSMIQGDDSSVHKINLTKPCVWTTIIQKDAKDHGLIIVYQTGEMEVRFFPDLEIVGDTSLMAILRWNFKMNMDKMMSSSDNGQITMVHQSEFAIVSLLAFENDLRIPEALPCLHDKNVAAAPDDAVSRSSIQKKEKGLKVVEAEETMYHTKAREALLAHLEGIFSRFPFSDSCTNILDDLGDIKLNIDDLEIDEPFAVTSSSSASNNDKSAKGTERERLFDGGSTDKPRLRTREEIIAKYRNTEDATSAAALAKDKLLERQEKLEKLSRRTEELQDGAQSFAQMANELAKTMEKRKWWNL